MYSEECAAVAAADAVRQLKVALLSRNPRWCAESADENCKDGSWLILQCEQALSLVENGCVQCCEGALQILLARMEAGFPLFGERLASDQCFWKRPMSMALLANAGFDESRIAVIIQKVDEWLESDDL